MKHYRFGTQYLGVFVDGEPDDADAVECPAPANASDKWAEGSWVEQVVAPAIVSRAQGIVALHNMGQLAAVEAAVDLADELTRLAWQSVTEFHRDSPMIAAIAAELNLDLDTLFTEAAKIKL